MHHHGIVTKMLPSKSNTCILEYQQSLIPINLTQIMDFIVKIAVTRTPQVEYPPPRSGLTTSFKLAISE